MRISDWSSDVCSSDLSPGGLIVFERLLFVAALLLASRAAEARPQEPLQPLKDRYCHAVTAATDPIVAPAPSRFTCGGEPSGYADGDRKSVVQGKRGTVRVIYGGRRVIKKKKKKD